MKGLIKSLNPTVERLEQRLEDLEKQVKQTMCHHPLDSRSFEIGPHRCFTKCSECHLVIDVYPPKDLYRKKAEHYRELSTEWPVPEDK